MSRALLVVVAFVTVACGASETEPLATRTSAPIAFVRGDRELVVVELDGGNERMVAQGSAGSKVELISWSPDGRQILFHRGARELVLVKPDGSIERTIARLPRGHSLSGFSWSPDGRRMLVSIETNDPTPSYDHYVDIYVADADGSNRRRIKRTHVYTEHPQWSPLGDAVIIDDNDDGSHSMWVVTLDGKARRLPLGPRYGNPAWSPDGTRIAYDGPGGFRDYDWGIYVMNADGGGSMRITKGGNPTWAPQEHIAFLFEEDRWVVKPDGTGRRHATEAERLLPLGEVSPDGRMIASSSSKVFRGNHDLYVHEIPNGAARKLTDSELHDCCPTWSPDGKSLAFLRAKRGWRPDGLLDPGDVYVINADGSGERKLTSSGNASWPFWSPGS